MPDTYREKPTHLLNRRIYFVAALRLIAIPLAAMLLLWLVKHALTAANAPQILLIILLALIMPPSSTVTQLAQLYQNDADYCGSINVLATLLSIATMPVMIALWEHLP